MDKMQFEKGQIIVYGTSGICVIDDIKPVKITMDSKPELYYVLKLLKDEQSKVFVPVNNEKLTSKMRDLMKKEDIIDMLKGGRSDIMEWNTDRRERAETFRDILVDGVSDDLLRMVVCLYERKKKLYVTGKKLPVTDGNTLKSAVKLLEEEVAYVLNIEEDKVGAYIRKQLGISEDMEFEQ
ncbi:MAG: CarD family transcriptional regulator [Bacillota bacterium]|nr:CarD family transcriptional regulator [Bacillota bacterium]